MTPQSLNRGVKRMLRRLDWSRAPLRFSSTLRTLPDLPETDDVSVRLMNPDRNEDVAAWLAIMNEAFNTEWDADRYRDAILEHPRYRVLETWFLEHEGEPLVTGSLGVYRANPDLGVTHYLGARRAARGRGWGRHLLLHLLHRLRALGVAGCETESTFRHEQSLRIHLDFGFEPKPQVDAWNTPREEQYVLAHAQCAQRVATVQTQLHVAALKPLAVLDSHRVIHGEVGCRIQLTPQRPALSLGLQLQQCRLDVCTR